MTRAHTDTAEYTCTVASWADRHTEYIARGVEGDTWQAAVGGPGWTSPCRRALRLR